MAAADAQRRVARVLYRALHRAGKKWVRAYDKSGELQESPYLLQVLCLRRPKMGLIDFSKGPLHEAGGMQAMNDADEFLCKLKIDGRTEPAHVVGLRGLRQEFERPTREGEDGSARIDYAFEVLKNLNVGNKFADVLLESLPPPTPKEDEEGGVRWLPPLALLKDSEPSAQSARGGEEGTVVLPLFPLGSQVYLPFFQPNLRIFEPRYQALYKDIVADKSRRLAVCVIDEETDCVAKYASVLHIKELEDVNDADSMGGVKYIVTHEVVGRIKINKVINPSAWEAQRTYLLVEGEYVKDFVEGEEESLGEVEAEVVERCSELMELQKELNVEPLLDSMVPNLRGLFPSPGKGFWTALGVWYEFEVQKIVHQGKALKEEWEARMLKYLKEKSDKQDVVALGDVLRNLPPDLLELGEATNLLGEQIRLRDKMLLALQSESHATSLEVFQKFIKEEKELMEDRFFKERGFPAQNLHKREPPSDKPEA